MQHSIIIGCTRVQPITIDNSISVVEVVKNQTSGKRENWIGLAGKRRISPMKNYSNAFGVVGERKKKKRKKKENTRVASVGAWLSLWKTFTLLLLANFVAGNLQTRARACHSFGPCIYESIRYRCKGGGDDCNCDSKTDHEYVSRGARDLLCTLFLQRDSLQQFRASFPPFRSDNMFRENV